MNLCITPSGCRLVKLRSLFIPYLIAASCRLPSKRFQNSHFWGTSHRSLIWPFEARPRARCAKAAPPCSSYLASSRKVCRTPSANAAAVDVAVRFPARTSVSPESVSDHSLIRTSPIQLVSFLMGGTMTFVKSAYNVTIHKLHYHT